MRIVLTYIFIFSALIAEASIGIFSEPMQNGIRLYPGQESSELSYELKLYDMANHTSYSGDKLIKENFYYTDETYMLNGSAVLKGDGKKVNITSSSSYYSSVIHLAFQEFYLTFSERENGFIKVRLAEADYWMSEEEIEAEGLEVILWEDYFRVGSDYSISALEDLSVYEDALDSADLSAIIPGDSHYKVSQKDPYYQIESILMIEGKWMQVAIKEWASWDDWAKDRPEKDTIIGWIIYLDEQGSTRIFSTENFGC